MNSHMFNIRTKMDSIVLLSVLAITNTLVLARPADMVLKTKRSLENHSGEVHNFKTPQIKLPTEIKEGFEITLNGTIDDEDEIFEMIVEAAGGNEDDHCKITYHLNNKTVSVLPAPQQEDSQIVLESGEMNTVKGHPTFSVKLIVASMGFKILFESNGVLASSTLTCPKNNYDDFGYLTFRKGLHTIDSLLFEFKAPI